MFPFTKLDVWHRAHGLTRSLLQTIPPPSDAQTRFVAHQIWRSAASVSANIAEGAGSSSHAQFARYLGIAIASAGELQNHLMLARDASLISEQVATTALAEADQVRRMLWALRSRVRADPRSVAAR